MRRTRLIAAVSLVSLVGLCAYQAHADYPSWWCVDDGWTLGLIYEFEEPYSNPPDSFCVTPGYFEYEGTVWEWDGPFEWYDDYGGLGGNGTWVLPQGEIGTLRIVFDNDRIFWQTKDVYVEFAVSRFLDFFLGEHAWLETDENSVITYQQLSDGLDVGNWVYYELEGTIDPQPDWERLAIYLDATAAEIGITLMEFGSHCYAATPVENETWGRIRSLYR